MNLIEKILAQHSGNEIVKPGQIIDVNIDVRAARDFGGANVVKNMQDHLLTLDDPAKTFFTFDCNPTGSNQKYAINQHICRLYARKMGIKVYDIDNGIGTHTLIHKGLACSGSTVVTTDSHANILGAVGAFGQGMGDKDITAAWHTGKVWFKVPYSVKLTLKGKRPEKVSAKDIVLNLLEYFGASQLLGYSVEIYGDEVENLTLDERITIASMATEMGALTILFTPSKEILHYSSQKAGKKINLVKADPNAQYNREYELDISQFSRKISLPGAPHHTVDIRGIEPVKIDSGFIGSCTNGRIEDLRTAAKVLQGRKVAPGVVLKIVPATDEVWRQAMKEGLLRTFKEAGAMISNAGCAGCAAGQVGQNGEGEVTVSTGNRNFPGKQGRGEVYLASPEVVAASTIAGYITTPEKIPAKPRLFHSGKKKIHPKQLVRKEDVAEKPVILVGRVWHIKKDNIDTDMIFHNRYLTITDVKEMGQYAFDNLDGYKDFAKKARKSDIIITQKNFGSGSSRQQAVDCFKSLGVQCILAASFGAIYERNAINAALPILTYRGIQSLNLKDGDIVEINLEKGRVKNLKNNKVAQVNPFSEVQMEIYQNGGLF